MQGGISTQALSQKLQHLAGFMRSTFCSRSCCSLLEAFKGSSPLSGPHQRSMRSLGTTKTTTKAHAKVLENLSRALGRTCRPRVACGLVARPPYCSSLSGLETRQVSGPRHCHLKILQSSSRQASEAPMQSLKDEAEAAAASLPQ